MKSTIGARMIRAIALLSLVAPLAGCVKNAATGRSQFNLLSREEEVQLGEEAKGQLTDEYGGRVKDPALQSYVTEVGSRMLPHIEKEYKDLPWEFILLDSDVINAFALPGGKVFMSRGLASKMTDEAQLAGVLGHEIGHVTAEHADKRISSNLGLQIGVSIAAVVAGQTTGGWVAQAIPEVVGAAGQGFVMKFSRDEESEADSLGLRYMSKAGYDPRAQIDVMKILRDASQGSGGSPEWLSTHPLPSTRIERVIEEIKKSYEGVKGERHADRFQREFLARLPKPEPKPAPKAEAEQLSTPAVAAAAPSHGGSAFSRYFAREHDPLFCWQCNPSSIP